MSINVLKIGFLSGMIAFCATLAFCIVQTLQLYDVLKYPTDEQLIYGTSLCIVIPFILEILALHYTMPDETKFWTHLALIFTVLYAGFVTSNYVVQLATVIPSTLRGSLDEVRILQQTPHSLFWNFDALGYIFMGLANAAAIPAFSTRGFERWVKISFIANAAVTPLITIVYFYPTYTPKILILGFPWAVTAPISMLFLAILFRKKLLMNKLHPGLDKENDQPGE